MSIIERFFAAPKRQKIGAALLVPSGLLLFCFGVACLCFWSMAWGSFVLVLGLVLVPCVILEGLYRELLGTIGLLAIEFVVVCVAVYFMFANISSFEVHRLLPPIACIVGMFHLWRQRPMECQRYLVPGELAKYVATLTADLQRIEPQTPFHAVIGRDFNSQIDEAAAWLADVYDDGAEDFEVTAIFAEINRFDINTDQWYLDGSTFDMPAAKLFDDLEYNLGEYENVYERPFVLTGMEDIQTAFEETNEKDIFDSEVPEEQKLMEAMAIAFDLITLRAIEMLAAAHRQAERRGRHAGSVRVFANVHDSMFPPVCSPA